MSIFRKKPKGVPNLSNKIQHEHSWRIQQEESFTAGERLTAVAYDPLLQVIACGFANGELHLYGSAPVHFSFHVPHFNNQDITHIQIAPTPKRLLCLVGGQMVVWSLDGTLEDRPLATVKLPGGAAFVGVSPIHSHALIPHSDGTVHLYDLSRLCESPTKIVPSPEVSEEVIMDIISNPRNADLLVVATYGSIYLWQSSVHQSPRKFTLPEDVQLRPVCLEFHPNEPIFAAGLIDGRISLWGIDDSVPLWITTISELIGDVQGAGVASEVLEPVFKLSWSWASGISRLTILGGQPAGKRLTTLEFIGTPLSETDQLAATTSNTYDEYNTANIKDFVVLDSSEHILALTEEGSLISIPLSSPAKSDADIVIGPQGSLHVPYELRRPIVTGQIVGCPMEKLRQISPGFEEFKSKTMANGGVSHLHISKDAPDPRLVKYDTPLLLIALHEDGLILFDDISPRLWVESEELRFPYPNPLSNISIDLKLILDEPLLWASLDDASSLSVQEITLIPEVLELYALFKTGQLLVWKYTDKPPVETPSSVSDQRLVDLSALRREPHSFVPSFLFTCKEGPCVAFATCEVGFIAMAYANGSIYVVDMRGPNIIHHQHLRGSEGDEISNMHFVICRPEPKAPERLYLLVYRVSGVASILVLIKGSSGWMVDGKIEEIPLRKSLSQPVSCLLVDILTGEELTASAKAFTSVLSEKVGDKSSTLSFEGSFFRVTVSAIAVRCDTGLIGKHIKTIQIDGTLNTALISINASAVLVLFRKGGNVTILSLPNLETIVDFQEVALTDSTMLTARVINATGDFAVQPEHRLEIWSTVANPRVLKPDVTIPSNLSSSSGQEGGLMSWLLGSRAMTGEEFDALVAGPNRPPLPSAALPSLARTAGNELKDALAATEERGRLAATLADKTDELGMAAEGMAAQAQKLAAKTQTKKRRFGF